MYVYLREAFSLLLGFLYGWTLLTVIQTGTIAAVGIAFARFSGVLFPAIREDKYLLVPCASCPAMRSPSRPHNCWPSSSSSSSPSSTAMACGGASSSRTSSPLPNSAAWPRCWYRVPWSLPASSGTPRKLCRALASAERDPDPRPGGDHRIRPLHRPLRLADRLTLLRGFLA